MSFPCEGYFVDELLLALGDVVDVAPVCIIAVDEDVLISFFSLFQEGQLVDWFTGGVGYVMVELAGVLLAGGMQGYGDVALCVDGDDFEDAVGIDENWSMLRAFPCFPVEVDVAGGVEQVCGDEDVSCGDVELLEGLYDSVRCVAPLILSGAVGVDAANFRIGHGDSFPLRS